MGAGKTRVGSWLAQRLQVPFQDSDEAIVRRSGRSIAQIFAEESEAAFRTLEATVIADLLAPEPSGPGPWGGVLALGGGAAMHPGTQDLLRRRATTVHLRVSLATALGRVGSDIGRPMLHRDDVATLHATRQAVYDALADAHVDTDHLAPSEVVHAILHHLPPASPQTSP